MGRRALGNKGRTLTLAIKVSADERRVWEAAARAAGLTMSEWIRQRCNG